MAQTMRIYILIYILYYIYINYVYVSFFKISAFDEKNVSYRLYGSLYGDLLVDIVVNYTYKYLVISKSPVFVEQHFEVIQLYITCFIRPTKTWLDLRRLDLRKS
jgi:hypothetical protein